MRGEDQAFGLWVVSGRGAYARGLGRRWYLDRGLVDAPGLSKALHEGVLVVFLQLRGRVDRDLSFDGLWAHLNRLDLGLRVCEIGHARIEIVECDVRTVNLDALKTAEAAGLVRAGGLLDKKVDAQLDRGEVLRRRGGGEQAAKGALQKSAASRQRGRKRAAERGWEGGERMCLPATTACFGRLSAVPAG